ADTIYVCWDGSGDYLTIQEGINAAFDGDEVVVCDGTYTGPGNRDLDFGGKPITVRSESGPDNCIIDCEGSGRGFYFHTGEGVASVVDAFTIRNGSAGEGGRVYCHYLSSPTISNCTISGNSAGYGGGVRCSSSRPMITNCTITDNAASNWGTGVYCSSSNPTITNCAISGNSADYDGGGVYCDTSNPTITNCTISGNSAYYDGGGVYCNNDSHPMISNCTISENSAFHGGGGVCCNDSSSPTITNCILWADTPDEIYPGEYGDPVVRYSDVQGDWPGNGNIDADPLFVDPPNADYHVSGDSPCIDAADNEAVPPDELDLDEDGDTTEPIPFDLDGNPRFADDPCTDDTGNPNPDYPDLPIVDMGAYEYQPCTGDLDCDGDTDQSDLGILLADWGCTGGDCEGDLDGDGDTDHSDLGILLADWGCDINP
ncbi:MAG TPA: right-handed parallel beta-helix repeat-containing protein, partial [Phycisphaerae bacterium]|nr:right-handed parallel beta-helix repeat-containing protein [Phycisphaerae bacterium]